MVEIVAKKTYESSFIYSFKEKNELTPELLLIFESINELFKTSSQYIDMKKRINLNIKWKLKKKDEVNIVLNALNRICKSNYEQIKNEIMNVNITNIDDMTKLTNNIINKMMSEIQFIDLYSQLIYDLMMNGKWIVDKTSFRKVFINKLEEMYSTVNNSDFDKNFFKIIYSCHKRKIIGHNLLKHIIDDLKLKMKEERYMEYFIILWHALPEYGRDYVNEIYNTLSKRLQFMIQDNPSEEQINNKNKNVEQIDNSKYINYIFYIDEFNSIEEMLDDVNKECNFTDFLKILLKYTIDEPKSINLILKVLKIGLTKKCWKTSDIKALTENIKTHELDDIILDAPYYKKHLEDINKLVT